MNTSDNAGTSEILTGILACMMGHLVNHVQRPQIGYEL